MKILSSVSFGVIVALLIILAIATIDGMWFRENTRLA
jgi:hypothetical protein